MTRRDRRAYTSAADDRAAKAKRKAALQIGAVAIVVIVVGLIYARVAMSHRELDKVTLCPSDPKSITVLLVDVTDPMNVAQRQDFQNQLTRLKNSIPRYGELIVAKVDASSERLLAPVIIRCNPGTAADVDEATGDPKAVQKLWDDGFDKPLEAAFKQIAEASGAEHSPILESIQSVALTEFQKPSVEGKARRLIVASDLLQNTTDVSFYRTLPDAAAFIESPAFRKARTNLKGVDVELWMLQRVDGKQTQPRALPDLWDRIITQQGGNLTRVYNVSG